jgi:hypothetical protein
MNISGAQSRVETLTRELLRTWDETKASWRDVKADEFQAQYINELIVQAEKTKSVMEKLEHLLARVRDDCE